LERLDLENHQIAGIALPNDVSGGKVGKIK